MPTTSDDPHDFHDSPHTWPRMGRQGRWSASVLIPGDASLFIIPLVRRPPGERSGCPTRGPALRRLIPDLGAPRASFSRGPTPGKSAEISCDVGNGSSGFTAACPPMHNIRAVAMLMGRRTDQRASFTRRIHAHKLGPFRLNQQGHPTQRQRERRRCEALAKLFRAAVMRISWPDM